MIIIKPPYSLSAAANSKFSVFLAGSIEMGKAIDWQQKIEAGLSDVEHICIFNPRRENWDASWKQEIGNAQFNEQVQWELDAQEMADMIVFYFAPGTQSPVTMLELGLFARTGKVVVCCPEGFWRKGNVDIVCEKYKIEQVNEIEELILKIKTRIA